MSDINYAHRKLSESVIGCSQSTLIVLFYFFNIVFLTVNNMHLTADNMDMSNVAAAVVAAFRLLLSGATSHYGCCV
jgi:hypothetical protein